MLSGASEFLTLYIKISISCNRLFSRLESLPFSRSSSYVAFLSLFTARNARSCNLSNFLASDALQKCHTMLQYVKLGKIADLYKVLFKVQALTVI